MFYKSKFFFDDIRFCINMLERMRETSSTIYNAVNGVSYGLRLFYGEPFYAGFFMNEKRTTLVHKNI